MSQTQQVLVLPAKGEALQLQKAPIPEASSGSAVIKVLATSISPNSNKIFSGGLPLPLSTPIIPGSSSVGRIHALGPDSTFFKKDQLVYVDFFVRSRDDRDASVLQGYMRGFDEGASKLMEGEWRNGSFAEYAKYPLESVYALDEDLLVKKMGYTLPDLAKLGGLFVSAGGLYDLDVKAGDSVIVAPATGHFGGAVVHLALAMGARVIAAARNEKTLARMADVFKSTGRISTAKLTGDVETDTKTLKQASGSSKGADHYVDFSPPAAAKTTHIQACLAALRPFGRACLMGGIFANVEIPYFYVIRNSIRIYGRYMYERQHAEQVIKLLEAGLLKLGPGDQSGTHVEAGFKLKDAKAACDAAEAGSWGHLVVMEP
ncbi:MAG: hypothetical protein MMC23_007829 [Stictis urceolatum]|nr:hypothetical protein [Stictis urceolata]